MGPSGKSRIRKTYQALRAWRACNGDKERAHTTGVYLAPSKSGVPEPHLVVYVDSNVLLSDFRTNADIYLGRLANGGFAVSGIEFRLSRDTNRHYSSAAPKQSLPELSQEEEQQLDLMVTDLPDGLRDKARSAAELSWRRNMLRDA